MISHHVTCQLSKSGPPKQSSHFFTHTHKMGRKHESHNWATISPAGEEGCTFICLLRCTYTHCFAYLHSNTLQTHTDTHTPSVVNPVQMCAMYSGKKTEWTDVYKNKWKKWTETHTDMSRGKTDVNKDNRKQTMEEFHTKWKCVRGDMLPFIRTNLGVHSVVRCFGTSHNL